MNTQTFTRRHTVTRYRVYLIPVVQKESRRLKHCLCLCVIQVVRHARFKLRIMHAFWQPQAECRSTPPQRVTTPTAAGKTSDTVLGTS